MGKALDSEVATAELCSRLANLVAGTPARWGKMNAHQMMVHLTDSFRAVHGERPAGSVSNWFSSGPMRWVALHTPVKWPAGSPTMPELAQDGGGTPPADWSNDMAALAELIRGVPHRTSYTAHPFFGKMTLQEWRIWAYRHCDHHFRQFGI